MSPSSDTVGIVVSGPGRAELLPVDPVPSARGGRVAPELPPFGDDEVSGEAVCTLVSPGTEVAGTFRPPTAEVATPYPWVPGYAAVFRIDRVGAAVQGLAPGDLVFSQGSHRSRQRERADAVWRIPDGLDPFRAVFARLMSIPMSTLTTTRARPGAAVGVSGLGPVGHLAAAVFAAAGYRVTAWDPRAERRALVPASVAVRSDAPEPVERMQFGNPRGLDLVLECSGHDGAALTATRTVRAGGEVVLIGAPWTRRTDATAHDLLTEVFHRYVTLRSGWEWQLPSRPAPFVHGSMSDNIEQALRWLHDGTVVVDHLADRRSPTEAQEVYTALADGTAQHLTTVFDWTGSGAGR
jgi:NADPH:quinone reductase-like Zn-dependent oxidoreductase